MPKGAKHPVITSDNPNLKDWRHLVASAAGRVITKTGWRQPKGAVRLMVVFKLRRPKGLPKRVVHHIMKPDLDKLVRAVKDALSKVAYADDGQVVAIKAEKCYADVGEVPHAVIVITSLEE